MNRVRDDNRFAEDAVVAFAIYCDECGLSLDEGLELADRISQGLESAAEDRAIYLPAGSGEE